MDLALSPYHLTTRDPAALAALLLGDSVTTMLPTPVSGSEEREQVALALRRSPPYARMLDSWRWAMPLFRSGIVSSLCRGEDALEDARAVCRRLAEEADWSRLRPFLHPEAFAGGEGYLDGVSTDILKGGPDPGWSLPIVAGLDALALRRGLIVVRAGGAGAGVGGTHARGGGGRSGAGGGGLGRGGGGVWRGSTAQQAEWRLGESCFTVAAPVLTQAGPGTIEAARRELAQPLADLRSAIDVCFAASLGVGEGGAGGGGGGGGGGERIRAAARVYGQAFEAFIRGRGGRGQDDDEGRQVLDAFVRVSGVRLPADAAMLAALVAASQLGLGAGGGARSRSGSGAAAAAVRPLPALVIELMNVTPAR